MLKTEETAIRKIFADRAITPENASRIEFQNTFIEVLDTSKKFIANRISKINDDEGSLLQTMRKNRYAEVYGTYGILVIHSIPILDFRGGISFDLLRVGSQMSNLKFLDKYPLQCYDRSSDRLVYYDKFTTYTKIFKHGSIESASNFLYTNIGANSGQQSANVILPLELIPRLNNALKSHVILSNIIGASVPIYVQITLKNLVNVSIFNPNIHSRFHNNYGNAISREKIELEGSYVTDYEESHELLIRQLNLIWNAFGMDKCDYIDASGNFTIELEF